MNPDAQGYRLNINN